MENRVGELINIVKFSIVGVSNTLLNFVIFILLNSIGTNYMIASIIAYSISIVNSYFWNSRLVFKCDNKDKKSVITKFVILNLIGLSINTLLMALLV
ncbi:MAG: GtrA family protein, partial [Clostridium perfringens]|nr:GtrA family protein [Clostridium perfringens]